MNLQTLVELASLFFGGLLAGIEFVIHYGLRGPAETLDERAQIALRQALILRLRVLVPAFFAPTMLLAIGAIVLDSGTPGSQLRYAGLLAMLIWVFLRVVGTVRINSATLTWQPSAPPKDWSQQINTAERFHIVGVWAVVSAFATSLVATALRLTSH
jgi:hypothetical protein